MAAVKALGLFLQLCFSKLMLLARTAQSSASVFARDTGHGLLEVSHNTFALLGLMVVGGLLFISSRTDLRHEIEASTLGWLQERQEARAEPDAKLAAELSEPDAIARATAIDPKELSRQQALVAQWLSKRYRVAPEPISRLVKEAWYLGDRVKLDPTLILAIMAIESSFNPFAQSNVGAQGLMQVMTQVHDQKYEAFGGNFAAFDPVTNLRVGVQVLKECIARAGSLEAGLKHYVGAANLPEDGGYAARVLTEQGHLRMVANGKTVALNVPSTAPQAATTAAAATTSSVSVATAASSPAAKITPEAAMESPRLKPDAESVPVKTEAKPEARPSAEQVATLN
jgi:Transglycosylase SLT domain